MSTTSELKKIAIALGGTGKGSSTAELIDEIEDQIASGHGGGSGGGAFVVNISGAGDGNYTADKTFAEIKDAFEDGAMPIAIHEDFGTVYNLSNFLFTSSPFSDPNFKFSNVYISNEDSKVHVDMFVITAEGVSLNIDTYPSIV